MHLCSLYLFSIDCKQLLVLQIPTLLVLLPLCRSLWSSVMQLKSKEYGQHGLKFYKDRHRMTFLCVFVLRHINHLIYMYMYMTWIIPFEVNGMHEVSVQIPTYTCVWAGAKNMAAVTQHIANKHAKGCLTCYRQDLQQSNLLDGSTKYFCFQVS